MQRTLIVLTLRQLDILYHFFALVSELICCLHSLFQVTVRLVFSCFIGAETIKSQIALAPPEDRHWFSSCMTKAQIEYVKREDARTKGFIRLAKYWRTLYSKTLLDPKRGVPKSYMLEIIVIHLVRAKSISSPTVFVKEFLSLMENYSSLAIGASSERYLLGKF